MRAIPGTHVLIDDSKTDDLKGYLGATPYPLAHVQMTAGFTQKYPETTQRVVNIETSFLRAVVDGCTCVL